MRKEGWSSKGSKKLEMSLQKCFSVTKKCSCLKYILLARCVLLLPCDHLLGEIRRDILSFGKWWSYRVEMLVWCFGVLSVSLWCIEVIEYFKSGPGFGSSDCADNMWNYSFKLLDLLEILIINISLSWFLGVFIAQKEGS